MIIWFTFLLWHADGYYHEREFYFMRITITRKVVLIPNKNILAKLSEYILCLLSGYIWNKFLFLGTSLSLFKVVFQISSVCFYINRISNIFKYSSYFKIVYSRYHLGCFPLDMHQFSQVILKPGSQNWTQYPKYNSTSVEKAAIICTLLSWHYISINKPRLDTWMVTRMWSLLPKLG